MDAHPLTWPRLDAAGRVDAPRATLAEAWEETEQTSSQAQKLLCTCSGTSTFLYSLLQFASEEVVAAHVPAIWDERIAPLCGFNAPAVSFPWNGTLPNQVLPPFPGVSEMVRLIVDRLHMDTPDIVLAVALLERLVTMHGVSIVQRHSVRPIFLAACIVARKLTSDLPAPTPAYVDAVSADFNNLTTIQGARIERQLLEYLDWQVPIDSELYKYHAQLLVDECALDHTHQINLEESPWSH